MVKLDSFYTFGFEGRFTFGRFFSPQQFPSEVFRCRSIGFYLVSHTPYWTFLLLTIYVIYTLFSLHKQQFGNVNIFQTRVLCEQAFDIFTFLHFLHFICICRLLSRKLPLFFMFIYVFHICGLRFFIFVYFCCFISLSVFLTIIIFIKSLFSLFSLFQVFIILKLFWGFFCIFFYLASKKCF